LTSVTRLTAVYPGTFDPMTLGHEDLIHRASRLFERLIVAVAAGHHKRTMFTIDERLDMAQQLSAKYANVEVISYRGLLRDFVVENAGKVVVRGLRAVSDFEYEFQMAGMNRQLMPEVETLFLTSTSSSRAPSCARSRCWVERCRSSFRPRSTCACASAPAMHP
jgi:pantetheine-phosphate adenylyltransferase